MINTPASPKAFPNIGILESKLPFDLFENLKATIDNVSNSDEKYNSNLLGHMQEEYSLNHIKDNMADFLLAMASTWKDANPGYIESFEEASKCKKYKLILDKLWVNKQKKYEFNPIHVHTGVLSFVIWIKIPYDLENEESYFPPSSSETESDRSNSFTSKLAFIYSDILGRTQTTAVPIDKSWEGSILMFPAGLNHCVHPFYTSDDYRISVSGNIRIDTNTN
jgi:hypothetical protein